MLISLAIGYILLALAEILPKYIKDKEIGNTVSLLLALISFFIFLITVIKIK